jgi:hypothetical protein
MIKITTVFVAALGATTFLTTVAAGAADATPSKEASAAAEQTANKDLMKFSADGASAFQDMSLTRRALYEGRTDDAKKFVALAESGFEKAKSDNKVFTKAEAELKSPAGADAQPPKAAAADAKPEAKAPIAWVPIDSSITLAEDVAGNPAKTAAVADANKSLKNGDLDEAMNKLKAAKIAVAVTLAVMPIDSTIEKVRKAEQLIDAGKYYEGGQELRLAQADERFDMIGDMGTPKE